MKQFIKRILPKQLHYLYNRVVSRKKIRAIYGDWFVLDWKKQAAKADESTWKDVYNQSWEHWSQQDLSPLDLERISAKVPGNVTVLDAGCGDGYLLEALQGHGRTLTGIDLSELAIQKAHQRLKQNVTLLSGNIEHLPFPDKAFNTVVSAHTLEHVKDFDAAVKELIRVCSQRLIILIPAQEYLPYTEDYHLHFFPHENDIRDRIPVASTNIEHYTIPPGVCAYNGKVWLITAVIN